MKTGFYAHSAASFSQRIFNAALAGLMLLALHETSFGQSSYTDVSSSGDSVVAYGVMSGSYMMGSHIDSTNVSLSGPSGSAYGSGGNSATVSLSIGEGGTFSAYTSHDSYCPDSGTTYGGVASSSGQITTCPDTCTPCRASRQNQTTLCYVALGACEAAALGILNNALTACDNNNFCNPNSPQYNQQQCDNCRSTAQENFAIASGACGAVFTGCMLTRPNCEDGTRKNTDCVTECRND